LLLELFTTSHFTTSLESFPRLAPISIFENR